MSILVLVQTGSSALSKKILNNYDFLQGNTDFGHFEPILTCFWLFLATVSVSKAWNEYICPGANWIECVEQKKF